jgi:hypothetical protein
MTHLPFAVERYLDRNAIKGPWQLAGEGRAGFAGAVVIPSLAEGDRLFKTLQSLAANPAQWTANFLVVVVINQGTHAAAGHQRQNGLDLARLADLGERSELCLAWVDAASPGCEVPSRQAGVGFARKLGMDLALARLDWSVEPLLVCLDADTLVEAGYLEAIAAHFRQSALGAAVLPFRHQPATSPVQQAAIERYELFLRSYVYGLSLAGSPYAFNSVGSAMACRASSYVRCGGMNCRKAGEDFYFLQKLAKTDGVGQLTGTTVFPEPRVSERVPFGTGRSMTRLLAGDARAILFYPAAVFRILAEWLRLAGENLSAPAEQLLAQAERISPVLANYLDQSGWSTVWPRLQSTHQTNAKRSQAFHAWFDGFRTMRLIHLLCDNGLRRGEPAEVLPEYFIWGGRRGSRTTAEMLEALRLLDGALQISLSKN